MRRALGELQPSGNLKAYESSVGKYAGEMFETAPWPSWSQLVVTSNVRFTRLPFQVGSAFGVRNPHLHNWHPLASALPLWSHHPPVLPDTCLDLWTEATSLRSPGEQLTPLTAPHMPWFYSPLPFGHSPPPKKRILECSQNRWILHMSCDPRKIEGKSLPCDGHFISSNTL